MHQDKDRGSKWLIAHHGDAILKLAGLTGFTGWRSLQSETIAPRRLPDGLLEVRFPDVPDPVLVLIEIESYPSADADRQVFEDVAIVFLERRRVPEVVSLILKPKGQLQVFGSIEHASVRKMTRIAGSWPVVQLWNLAADQLLADGDVGLVPWVPLTRSDLPPEELLGRCAERIAGVPNEAERSGLLAVTQILAGLAFPKLRFGRILGGPQAMIESPVLDEALELMEQQVTERVTKKVEAQIAQRVEAQVAQRVEAQVAQRVEAQVAQRLEAQVAEQSRIKLRESIRKILEKRFGSAPVEQLAKVDKLDRLDDLIIEAGICASMQDFVTRLNG